METKSYRVVRIAPQSGRREEVQPEDLADVLPSCADIARVIAGMAKSGRTRLYAGFYWEVDPLPLNFQR